MGSTEILYSGDRESMAGVQRTGMGSGRGVETGSSWLVGKLPLGDFNSGRLDHTELLCNSFIKV